MKALLVSLDTKVTVKQSLVGKWSVQLTSSNFDFFKLWLVNLLDFISYVLKIPIL